MGSSMNKNRLDYLTEVIKTKKDTLTNNTFRWIAHRLPKRLIYFTAIEMWAKTTTGKYGNTLVCELTVGEAIKRYNWYYCLDE